MTINGDVVSGGKLDVESEATIHGTATAGAALASTPLLGIPSFEPGSERVRVNEGETLVVYPGTYERIEARKNSTLSLMSGVYYCKSLLVRNDATLSIEAAAGGVTINIAEEIKFDDRARVDIATLGEGGSRQLTIQTYGDDAVKLEDEARFLGTIVAPNAKVELKKDVHFNGLIMAKEIKVRDRAVVVSHSYEVPALIERPLDVTVSKGQPAANDERDAAALPSRFVLRQNHPNPFNPETTIRFELAEPAHVVLRITTSSARKPDAW